MTNFITVPVVFITDHGYAMQTYIACKSLINTRHDNTRYEIILIENGLIEEDIINFKNIQNDAVNVKIVHADVEILTKRGIINNERWPLATYLKFFIADILVEYEKVIYLDGDVLVCQDLSSIFKTNIEDVYLGAVRDRLYDVFAHENRLKTQRYYFNTGFLLLNLKKMRDEHLSNIMIQLKTENPSYGLADQDTYNVACGDNVVLLPMKYNFYPQYFTMVEPIDYYKQNCTCDYNSRTEMWEDVAVIHMIGTRPWNLNKDDIGWIGSQYEHSLSKAPIGYITNTWFTLLKNSPYKDKLNSMTVYNNLEFFHKNSLVQVKKNVFLQYKMIFTPKEGAVLDIKIMFANICIVHRIKEPVESGRSGKLYVCGIPLTEKILKLKL